MTTLILLGLWLATTFAMLFFWRKWSITLGRFRVCQRERDHAISKAEEIYESYVAERNRNTQLSQRLGMDGIDQAIAEVKLVAKGLDVRIFAAHSPELVGIGPNASKEVITDADAREHLSNALQVLNRIKTEQ